MGRNIERPMIMLMPMVTRSASPRLNTPVTSPTRASSTARMGPPLLAPGLDLQPAAEQPRRFVEENQDENPEGEAVLPGRHEIGHAHRLDHAEDQRGHHGAHDVA